jgi:UDP-glucose 4-epimerase
MMAILVTGGAGYIGSHTVMELLRHGHEPIVYDNLQTGHRKAVRDARLIEGDLADLERLEETFRSFSIEAVIHFAADSLVGESMEDPLKYFVNNVKNSIQLLETMVRFDVKKIVFSSSAAVYGEPQEVPITEEHPCHPTNPYGETKWIFEKGLQALHRSGKIDYISLRYFNAAGADPGGELGEDHTPETHLIPICITSALKGRTVPIYGTNYDTPDGTCLRDYIHVTDLALAHLLALKSLGHEGTSGVYNLGNGSGYSVREVVRTVERVTGKKISTIESPPRPGDPARLVAGSDRIRKALGWVPKYPEVERIVETAYRWHLNHPTGMG